MEQTQANITNKANQSLGFFKRNLKIKSSDVKYHAYIWNMPRLFGIPILEPKLIIQIEKVQRRATRYVTNRYHNTSSVTDML